MAAPPSQSGLARRGGLRGAVGDAARLLVPGAVVVAAYAVLLSHRLDAAGHLAAGHGLALCLAAVLVLGRWPTRVVLAVGAAVVLGLVVEDQLFGRVLFDWFDVGNQTVGAALAGCVLLGSRRDEPVRFGVASLAGAVALVAGVLLALGPWFVERVGG